MRKIIGITVAYDDQSLESWVGAGTVAVVDTVSPGPPARSESYVTATLTIPPRQKINAAGQFTGKRRSSEKTTDET